MATLATLPTELQTNIASHLYHPKNLLSFGCSSSTIRDVIRDPYLWQQLIVARFGKSQLPPDEEQYRATYVRLHRGSERLHAADLSITWNDGRHWLMEDREQHAGSVSPQVATLRNVCWLEVAGTLRGVVRSNKTVYRPTFRIKVAGGARNFRQLESVQFGCAIVGAEGVEVETRSAAFRDFGDIAQDVWVLVKLEGFTTAAVDCGTFFDVNMWIRDHSSHWKHGLVIDTFELVAVKDGEGDETVTENESATATAVPVGQQQGTSSNTTMLGGGVIGAVINNMTSFLQNLF